MSATVNKILQIARAEIGVKATDYKRCKYNNWFYGSNVSGNNYDWCQVFVDWVFNQAGSLNLLYTKTAGCGVGGKAFYDKGQLHKSGFKPGDIVYFHWSNDKSNWIPNTYSLDHVGIIESVNSNGTITTIEGNTGSTSNGEVMRRVRSLSCVSCVGRPKYSAESTAKPAAVKTNSIPDVFYRVRTNGKWLKEVDNLLSYAGLIGRPITDIAIKVSKGSVKYRVHIKGGGWLPYVTGYNISDHKNGYAGDNKVIDAIEVYYNTPSDIAKKSGYLRAKYRVSPVKGGYYPWQYDNEKTGGQDGYAGVFGKSIDRVQITLLK